MPFDQETKANDYVILKLISSLTFNDDVYPACLPDPSFAPDTTGQTCFVSGWGALSFEGPSPETLQWVAIPLITNEECYEEFAHYDTSGFGMMPESTICAELPGTPGSICFGDSGGPLVCEGGDSRSSGNAVITGIPSWVVNCTAELLHVYARVTTVLDWIKSNMVIISNSI